MKLQKVIIVILLILIIINILCFRMTNTIINLITNLSIFVYLIYNFNQKSKK